MPSTARSLSIVAVVAGVLVVLYSFLLAHEPLLGLGAAIVCFVAAALLHTGDTDRETVAAVAMAVTVLYGVFTFQLPAAIVAACVVYLTLWVTDPDGPYDATPPAIISAAVVSETADAPVESEDEAAE
jgi:chromate transport protein ChrA